MEEVPSIETHLALDESVMLYYFNEMLTSDDEVLRDLSDRLLNRKLFEYEDYEEDPFMETKIRKELLDKGYDPKYYLSKDTLNQTPYFPYNKDTSQLVYILNKHGDVNELSEVSEIVSAISGGKEKQESKIFFPNLEESR